MKQPLVSVVMAVYNGQEYLNIAIDSILQQTYKNLELVIVDDGSTDNSSAIIANYSEPRIRYIHQANQGLASALNHGINQSKGDYIARMDCDDISYPTRLTQQVNFLEKNKNVALVGTSFDLIDLDGCIIDRSIHLDMTSDLRTEFLVRNPFGHGTVMVRKQVLKTIGSYDTSQPIEDYELWWRIAQQYPVASIAKQLYGWRVNPSSISHGHNIKRQREIRQLMKAMWNKELSTISKAMAVKSFTHYKKLGPKYQEQYTYFIAALCYAFWQKKYYVKASKLYSILIRLPGGRTAYKDIKKNPRSHNYNLANL